MPHKVNNDSNSTLASGGSSSDQVIATEVRGMSIQYGVRSTGNRNPTVPPHSISAEEHTPVPDLQIEPG